MTRTRLALVFRLLFCAYGFAIGAAGVALVGAGTPRAPEIHEQPFHLGRGPDDPFEVTDTRFLSIPWPFADFDLFATVELPEDGELDIVFRRVAPVQRGGDMPLFHGRFSLLRLSTIAPGPAYRTREQALFDDDPHGGQLLEAGRPATIHIEARGRRVRVNVAGVSHPWFEATDAHGSLAFVVRGGTALVHYLDLDPVARPNRLLPWAWGGLVGLLSALVLALRGVPLVRASLAFVAVPALAYIAGLTILSHLIPDTEPSDLALVVGGLSGLPPALAIAARGRFWVVLPAVITSALLWEATARLEAPRLAPLEDPRLSAYFGWGSGSAPVDALTRRMSGARIHTMRDVENRVVFLGGEPLFAFQGELREAGYLALMATVAAGRELGKPVEAVVVPTVYSHSLQQLALFRRFYLRDFRPRVLVFGVPPWEGEASETYPPRAVLEGRARLPSALGSVLLRLWTAASSDRVPTTDAADLRATLDELAELGRAEGFPIVVMDGPGLSPELARVAAEAAAAHGFVHLVDQLHVDGRIEAENLTAELVKLLR